MSDRTTSNFARGQQQDQRRNEVRTDIRTIGQTFDAQRDMFLEMAPSNINMEVFRNAFLTAVQTKPSLLDADRDSLWLALRRAATDGLMPDGRDGALVIFGDDAEDEDGNRVPSQAKGKKKVVWMPMVWGLTKLVRNTGLVASIHSTLIFQGDEYVISEENGKAEFRKLYRFGDGFSTANSDIIGCVAGVRYKDGTYEMEPMSLEQMDAVRRVSRAKNGPWNGPFASEMYRKTPLRRLFKRIARSPELQSAAAALDRDETLGPEIDGDRPIEVPVNTPQIAQDRSVADPINQAFQPDIRTQEPARRGRPPKAAAETRQDQRRDPPQDQRQDAGQTIDSKPADDPQDQQQTNSSDEVRYFPTDENGDPWLRDGIAQPFFTAPDVFARWFADAMSRSNNPEALHQQNMDMIAEAHADPAARKIIDDALETWRAERDKASRTTDTLADDAAALREMDRDPEPVAIPLTKNGAPHWPNYHEKCAKEIAALPDQPAITAWVERNGPTYQGKSGETKVVLMLADRQRAIVGPPADQVQQVSATDATKPAAAATPTATDAPAKSPLDVRADGLISDLDYYTSAGEVSAAANNAAVKRSFERFREEGRADLVDRVKAAYEARHAALMANGTAGD